MHLLPFFVMVDHLRREAEIGGYEAADEAEGRLDRVYDSVARLLGAASDEIALTLNATVAWQMGFYSLPFRAGDRILTVPNIPPIMWRSCGWPSALAR